MANFKINRTKPNYSAGQRYRSSSTMLRIIIELTLAGRTAGELADEIGCTRRTVYRMISAIEADGFPVYYDESIRERTFGSGSTGGVYRIHDTWLKGLIPREVLTFWQESTNRR